MVFFCLVVTVEFRQGLPVVTLPLPTNGENCQFAIRPVGNTIGEFVQLLKKEDKAVESVVVYNSGIRFFCVKVSISVHFWLLTLF